MSSLVLENVSYKYRGSEMAAVSDVNCAFLPGRMYALVGPSGSGKSTLLSLLAGLDDPSGGVITYDGISLASMDMDRYRREKVSMIFQAFRLFPLLTVLENVCYPMELNGMKPKEASPEAEKLLARVGITQEQMKRFPSQLSGGEQQRVAIARSLASGAQILLADEPTGNLDADNTDNIMAILTKLVDEEDYCVVVVTHDMDVAKYADIVYRMRDGELIRDAC